MESHYKCQQLKHQYVSLNLKTLKIIQLFQKRYTQTKLETFLENNFQWKTQLSLEKPKKEKCTVCIELENSTLEKKKKILKRRHNDHL